MRDTLTPTALGRALVLGPAAASIRRPRRRQPAEHVPRKAPKGVLGCLTFGFLVLTLLASPLLWDRVPWQP